jgi:6-pyruvoyltetrahydropterin/6-carboxytetrahydropterin synthase
MLYKVSVEKSFAGAHFLRNYKGKCENLHGHNWRVRACFCGTKLDECGMLLDFTNIKAGLDDILKILDHKFLNEAAPFISINPTAENIAFYIYNELKKFQTENARVCEVEVWESATSSAVASE